MGKTSPSELFAEIQHYCIIHADEAIVKKYSRYFKEDYNAYGLTQPLIEEKISEIFSAYNPNQAFILELSKLLIIGKKYEETSFAILMLNRFKKEFTIETFKALELWFQTGINNWAHCDFICGDLMLTFFKKDIISLFNIEPWRKSKRRFQRRAVPVSIIKLLKTQELSPLLNLIEPMMMDEERVVHQGLGWFLREAWKKHPLETEYFLLKWKDKSARLIFQYATEKMTPEEKARFRKVK